VAVVVAGFFSDHGHAFPTYPAGCGPAPAGVATTGLGGVGALASPTPANGE
jgi:hypothetical protein